VMNRTLVWVLLVLGGGLVYLALGSYSGRISLNDGLGPDGPIYAAMVTAHDVQGGTVSNRIWPAFPLAAAAAYAVTGDVTRSFAIVDVVAFLLLAFAACVILDAHTVPLMLQVSAVLTLSVLGVPTAMTAFSPAQPYLLGVALAALGVAACEAGGWLLVAAAQVAATLASPVGIIAPLYGLMRAWRLQQRSAWALGAFAPALLVWLLVQIWGRGGPLGLLELLRLSRVSADARLWTEFAFILFGAYFVMTSLGGLTILLWSHPRWIMEALRERSELWALLLPVILFVSTAGLDVPPMTAFLIPFWLLVLASWLRRQTSAPLVPITIAVVLTIVTQRPWARITDASYFVNWFPYSVHAARVNAVTLDDAALIAIWRPRVFIAAAGLVAFIGWWRASAPRQQT
jgi:hypothetical protein